MNVVYHRVTKIPSRNLEVSTVRWNADIGLDRDAETMAFPTDDTGKRLNADDQFYCGHGRGKTRTQLDALHDRIVAGITAEGPEYQP